MKSILITAKNSYIGNTFAKWTSEKYNIDFISCRTDEWKNSTFNNYDVVLHVAGIAHVGSKLDMESTYRRVNCDLSIDIAQKAKAEGVKQFIFMSSMIVFGESSVEHQNVIVNKDTMPSPNSFYGESKLLAEQGIQKLQDDNFNIVILRPPMIYGKDSKGNFPKLSKLARVVPIFPNIKNKRSMLHVDNLCEFIRLMIDNEEKGIFHPQNEEYVCTSEMVRMIAEIHGKKIRLTKVFNPLINIVSLKVNSLNKVFGTFIYEKSMSKYRENYWIRNFKDSIRVTEI